MDIRRHSIQEHSAPSTDVRPPPSSPRPRRRRAGGERRPPDPLVGVALDDRHAVVKRLDDRGRRVVYRGRRFADGERSDVLVEVGGPLAGEGAARRLADVVRGCARLQSGHTVRPLAAGRTPAGMTWVATEAVEGETLARRLADTGPLLWRRAVRIVAQVAESLAEAHAHGIAHGALTADDVLLVEPWDEAPFARVVGYGVHGADAATAERRDVDALGALLYELLTGHPPAHAADGEPPALEDANPLAEAPTALREVVRALLRRDTGTPLRDPATLAAHLAAIERAAPVTFVPGPGRAAVPTGAAVAYAPLAIWSSRMEGAGRGHAVGAPLMTILSLAAVLAALFGAL